MYDLVTFMIDRNVDFMGFLTFQLLMKLGDFDLALVLIRQKSEKFLPIIKNPVHVNSKFPKWQISKFQVGSENEIFITNRTHFRVITLIRTVRI